MGEADVEGAGKLLNQLRAGAEKRVQGSCLFTAETRVRFPLDCSNERAGSSYYFFGLEVELVLFRDEANQLS